MVSWKVSHEKHNLAEAWQILWIELDIVQKLLDVASVDTPIERCKLSDWFTNGACLSEFDDK